MGSLWNSSEERRLENYTMMILMWHIYLGILVAFATSIPKMEALIEEVVEPPNPNFEIDLDQTMNEKIMDEKLRSDSKCVVISGSEKGKPCVFKGFKFRGKSQNMCLPYYGKYWCATELRKNGQYKKWGYCSEACPYPDKGICKDKSRFLCHSRWITEKNCKKNRYKKNCKKSCKLCPSQSKAKNTTTTTTKA